MLVRSQFTETIDDFLKSPASTNNRKTELVKIVKQCWRSENWTRRWLFLKIELVNGCSTKMHSSMATLRRLGPSRAFLWTSDSVRVVLRRGESWKVTVFRRRWLLGFWGSTTSGWYQFNHFLAQTYIFVVDLTRFKSDLVLKSNFV